MSAFEIHLAFFNPEQGLSLVQRWTFLGEGGGESLTSIRNTPGNATEVTLQT